MRPREILHRVCEKAHSELERLGMSTTAPTLPEGPSFKEYLSRGPAQRFYFQDPKRLAAVIQEHFPNCLEAAIQDADELCRHRFKLLGYEPVELGREIDWHHDPVSGRTWKRRFWADYTLSRDCAAGDPKTIHELNRHQHLPRLAKAYLLTGSERYAAEAVAQIESWIEQNPPGIGIHWQSSLEIGIRTISWLWTVFLLLPAHSLDEGAARRIGESLFAQLDHVHRHTSIFTSPNTHLIGEATALFIGGLVFKDHPPAAAWLETGSALLAQEVEKQVLEDGVYGELSSYYHCYALDFYLQAVVLGERNAQGFPRTVRDRICKMLEFLMHLTRPDGTIPLLGDDDGGRALALAKTNYRSFSEALCLGAILFLREDFRHQAGKLSEEAVWFFGEEACRIFRWLGNEAPAKRQSYHPLGGYLIQRSGWGPLDSHLVFDCGGLGMLTGGHAHADALAVSLCSGGQELLADPGTFVYNGAPEWRDYFRSTRAHNTVTIDDRDQAEPAGTFGWQTKLHSRVTQHLEWATVEYIEAEHDGYQSAATGVIHRRRLLHVDSQYWVVVDDFSGAGRHTFDFAYHFAPGVAVHQLAGGAGKPEAELVASAKQAGLLVGLYADRPLETELLQGQVAPIGGWASPGYGAREPSSTLHARLSAVAPAAAITLLVPCLPASATELQDHAIERLHVDGEGVIACVHRHGPFEDLAIFSAGDTEFEVADFRMRGEFFWLRIEDGALKQVLAIRAWNCTRSRNVVFQRSEAGTYFAAKNIEPEQDHVCHLRNCEFQCS
jgi:heparinase II/III-like protein